MKAAVKFVVSFFSPAQECHIFKSFPKLILWFFHLLLNITYIFLLKTASL